MSAAGVARPGAGRGWMGLALVAAAVLAYANSLAVPFVFDDAHIRDSPLVHTLRPGWALLACQRPVAFYSLALNYAVGGMDVWGYHLVNLAIHAAAGLLLLGIAGRTLSGPRLQERYGPAAAPLALLIALVWTVHPLETQSVTYVVQRMESLMGLCYLATLYAFVRAQTSLRPRLWYAISVLCCAVGMGVKEVMVTAPLMVLWYDQALIAGSWREIVRRRALYYLPLACTWTVLLRIVPRMDRANLTAGGAVIVPGLPPYRYLTSQAGVIVHYLGLCFWPRGLCFDPGWRPADHWLEVAAPGLVVVALLALTVWCTFRHPAWGFVGGWFFVILAPTSSVMPLRDLAYEYRMYLPLAAVVTAVVLGAYGALTWAVRRRLIPPRTAVLAGVSAAAVAVVGLAALTHGRNEDYRSHVALWGDTVKKSPYNPRALNCLGWAYVEDGSFDAGVAALRQSLRLAPAYGAAHLNLGVALLGAGRAEEARAQYGTLLEYDPKSAAAYKGLGDALLTLGKTQEAIGKYQEAVRLDPHYPALHNNLGYALASSAAWDDAIAQYRLELQFNPESALAHLNLADARLHTGNLSAAIAQCELVLRLEPENIKALAMLAWLLATTAPPGGDNAARATALAQEACRLTQRQQPACLDVLAAAYAAAGRFHEAADTAQQALRLLAPPANTPSATRLAARLALYRQQRAFHLNLAPAADAEGSPLPGGINIR